MKKLLTAALLLCATGASHAETWRVDLLIFAHADGDMSEHGLRAEAVVDEQAIPISDRARLAANGIEILAPEASALSWHWQRLRNATAFRPLLRLSWLHRNPPRRGGPALLLRHGAPLLPLEGEAVHRLEGTLRLTLRRYLHLDADLRWTERNDADGLLRSWPLREQRRMRSETLHYLDGARIGVLAEIRKSE